MRLGVLALALTASCFQPQFSAGVACSPEGTCPPGLTCRTGRCARPDDPGAPRDAALVDGSRGDGPRGDGPRGDGPRRDGGRDASSRDAGLARCDPAGAFGPATVLAGLSSSGLDHPGSFSADGLVLYLSSDRPGGAGGMDLYRAQRSSLEAPFGAPVRVTELATTSSETRLFVTADGMDAIFTSYRAGHFAIWRATRSVPGGDFGAGQIVSALDTSMDNRDAVLWNDQLLFASDRAGGPGGLDLWVVPYTASTGAIGTPAPVAMVGSTNQELAPSIDATGRVLFFTSNRNGDFDVMVASRASTTTSFSAPTPIASAAVIGFDEREPVISPDGCELVFGRAPVGMVDFDLYVARRAGGSPPDAGPPDARSADACVATTCAAQNAQCGMIASGCGAMLTCPACPGAQTCGVGMPNRCACASYMRVNTEIANCNSNSAASYSDCINAGNDTSRCSQAEFEGWCRRGSNGGQSWFDVNRARMDARCPGTITFQNLVFTCRDETMCIEYHADVS
jgi:hypothetical protein